MHFPTGVDHALWDTCGAKLLRLSGRCGHWPTPVHSLAVATNPGAETIVAPCLHLWHLPWLLYTWSYRLQLFNPPSTFTKVGSCVLWACGIREHPWERPFASLVGPCFSHDSVSSWQLTQSSLWGLSPEAWAYSLPPAPTHCRHVSCFSAGKYCSTTISLVNFLRFAFRSPVSELITAVSSEVLKLPHNPACGVRGMIS